MASSLKQIPESLLASLWKERASREESLRAGNGRRLKVIYPGRLGTDAGPDFRDAVFEEEGVGLVRGDVEVHVRQRDWDAHGHGKDPRYNGVVLHVVARMDHAYSTLQSGGRVPVVALETLLYGPQSAGRRRDLWPLLGSHGYLRPSSPAEFAILLDRAGDSRFLEASAAVQVRLGEEDPEQVLYASLMEAMGYSRNRGPFLELAHRVPYRVLERVIVDAPPWRRLDLIQGLLLASAGFRPTSSNKSVTSRGGWHTFRVRPQNHPKRRIEGFAHLLDLFLPDSCEGAFEFAGSGRRDLPQEGVETLSPHGAGRRPRHAVSTSPEGTTPGVELPFARRGLVHGMTCLVRTSGGRVGAKGWWCPLEYGLRGVPRPISGTNSVPDSNAPIGRARDMAVNCVLPFMHALGQLKGDAPLEQLSLTFYRRFPSLQENEITREMREQLSPRPATAGSTGAGTGVDGGDEGHEMVVWNARRQQGLLHLHHLITSLATPSTGGLG